ncbi:uncharacterized protein Z518_11303 [Rhinocladiella mackenziei CBS 650.93]|uniref:Major facilitator superfamily (MFS) profile domain-containing protein n=1 Tax=Rhinocladiella mackenziei CBS 650.93 TaxID=1442369 RepID=A0A0D2IS67_9EURO|nr:uncharacterized protein Z518_11303 [Rhinocladiella mackenziei CBS 650.93]KIW99564.1 hypothetical protein Z518_11303 [Rhinocladiella mackenziei CBS 650.93]
MEIEVKLESPPTKTLGTLRLQATGTNEIIRIPRPTDDPNDPLNWNQAYKYYMAGISSMAIFLCTFVSAGPAIAIVDQAVTFFGPPGPDLLHNIARTAYFFTTTALTMGLSNIFWVPMAIKYGRRVVYLACFALFIATIAWAGAAKSYGSALAARILMGFAAGPPEVLGPLTISDIFFLHERGAMVVIYTCMLNLGAGLGTVVDGLITKDLSWRVIYWVAGSLVGFVWLLMLFTFPETTYLRSAGAFDEAPSTVAKEPSELSVVAIEHASETGERPAAGRKLTYLQSLRLVPAEPYTQESFITLGIRPIVLLILPAVLWATLVMSVCIGFFVAVSSNLATAYSVTYNMQTWQAGLCCVSIIVGALLAVFFGGKLSDLVANSLTARNSGLREPEMRLPAMALSVITGPLSLVLYGVGIEQRLHWICPTIGVGMLTFTIVQAANIALVYMIDCYRPIAGEVTVAMYAFKSAFGFLLSFYTNSWIEKSGYGNAFGAMAGITGAVLLGVVPFYFFGKRLRRLTWNWGIIRALAHWDSDREVGE